MQRTPNFLIIGAPRCGTSSLASYLRAHPDIYMAQEKEVRFFNQHFDRGLDWYLKRFAGVDGERAIGEATPRYMYEPEAVERIHATLPGVRLIAQLRDPVARAYSHYWMRRSRGRESRDFDTAVHDEIAQTARAFELGRDFPYLSPGIYHEPLNAVANLFGKESLFVTILEDAEQDPGHEYQGVCGFLDVDQSFAPPDLGRIVNGFAAPRSVAVRQLSKRLPRRAREAVNAFNAGTSAYPRLATDLREELVAYFEPHTSRLEDWLGRDLRAWRS